MLAYLKLDVYLLADVFETFRKVTLEQDALDPVHFVSLPGLSYQSAFKMTKESIHLLQDAEMYTLFERGIRGGLTFVNKHVVNSTQDIGSTTHLMYIDQNNLYGSALSKPLPQSDFQWVEPHDIEHFSNPAHIMALGDEADIGYLFEVDLIYPECIKNRTVDFPLAPESGIVSPDMFSPFMEEHNKKYEAENDLKYKATRKLLLTQLNKQHYIVHYSILKFYLGMGMQLDKVHRAIQFRQKPFLKPYIEFNSKKRAESKNPFEKDFFKFKNNALFGKTMEDVRKRMDYRIVTDPETSIKLCRSSLFCHHDVISEDITGFKMLKSKVELCKPIYVGQAVLDHSKLEVYKLFYHTLKRVHWSNMWN